MVNVYAPHVESDQASFWVELSALKNQFLAAGTKRQFQSWKAAQEQVNERKAKQNDQQAPRPQSENDDMHDQGVSQLQPEKDKDKA
ncbi:hypothetical protein V6N13_113611 [Hibiscus sabdariffa]